MFNNIDNQFTYTAPGDPVDNIFVNLINGVVGMDLFDTGSILHDYDSSINWLSLVQQRTDNFVSFDRALSLLTDVRHESEVTDIPIELLDVPNNYLGVVMNLFGAICDLNKLQVTNANAANSNAINGIMASLKMVYQAALHPKNVNKFHRGVVVERPHYLRPFDSQGINLTGMMFESNVSDINYSLNNT